MLYTERVDKSITYEVCMPVKYEFTLYVKPKVRSTSEIEDMVVEAGCDDALLCYSGETAYLEFSREGSSLDSVINTTIDSLVGVGFDIVV